MKVVVQNGANHCLSRRDAEAIVALLPESWHTRIRKLLFARGACLGTSFHRKESVFCLYSPLGFSDKQQAVAVLVRGIADALGTDVPEDLLVSASMAVRSTRAST